MLADGESAELHWRIGNCRHALGDFAKAARAYWSALMVRPDFPEATVNLSNTLIDLGKPATAVQELSTLLKRHPDYAPAHSALGSAHFAQGDGMEAAVAFARALELNPGDLLARLNLALIRIDQGEAASVLDDVRSMAGRYPQVPEIQNAFGLALRATGDLEAAVEAFRKALKSDPANPDYLTNSAGAWQLLGRLDKAGEAYQLAIEARPGFVPAYLGLGAALVIDGQAGEAEQFLLAAVQSDPVNAAAWSNLGNALKAQARYEEAISAYRKSIEIDDGDCGHWSNLLLCLQYDPSQTPENVWQEHLAFGKRFGDADGKNLPLAAPAVIEAGWRGDRRLRVGYVSADFRVHSVSFFLEPVLRAHDREAVEVICYSDVTAPDSVTARLRGLSDSWRDLRGCGNRAAADIVAADDVDLLIDLAGHTAGNRLGMFALKPAAVQATWLGYPGTSGLAEMDYRLTDSVADPDDGFHAERLVRLPTGFHCYGPPPGSPPPTRSTDRPPTFGSFNNLAKVTPEVMTAWARMTASVPDARLLLKARPLADEGVRERYRQIAADAGLPPERLELIGHVKDLAAHLALYAEVDVALDPFPYAGTTTTCEALWMGVPVVTLCGNSHAGRVGASLLTTTGLSEFIAESAGEAEGIARDLLSDTARLDDMRETLRGKVAGSPLCDAGAFTATLEDAVHAMWRAGHASG